MTKETKAKKAILKKKVKAKPAKVAGQTVATAHKTLPTSPRKEALEKPRKEALEKPRKERTSLETKEDTKKQPLSKCTIPKKVRTDVWNTFIGPNIPIHRCLCCLKTTICMTDFQVGHVLSEHCGGNLNIDNLRPICASCNISMGTTNMKEYVVKYGYLI